MQLLVFGNVFRLCAGFAAMEVDIYAPVTRLGSSQKIEITWSALLLSEIQLLQKEYSIQPYWRPKRKGKSNGIRVQRASGQEPARERTR